MQQVLCSLLVAGDGKRAGIITARAMICIHCGAGFGKTVAVTSCPFRWVFSRLGPTTWLRPRKCCDRIRSPGWR